MYLKCSQKHRELFVVRHRAETMLENEPLCKVSQLKVPSHLLTIHMFACLRFLDLLALTMVLKPLSTSDQKSSPLYLLQALSYALIKIVLLMLFYYHTIYNANTKTNGVRKTFETNFSVEELMKTTEAQSSKRRVLMSTFVNENIQFCIL